MRGSPRGDSEETKGLILAAARALFAERGIRSVTIRQIAARAGVSHSLVNRYFGAKDQMVVEIVRGEIESAAVSVPALDATPDVSLAALRTMLRRYLTDDRTAVQLIMRAELAGVEPEKMLHVSRQPIGMLAEWMAEERARNGGDPRARPDPALVSVVVGATIFSLASASPWLLSAVGLEPGDLDARLDEIIDILAGLVARTAGVPAQD